MGAGRALKELQRCGVITSANTSRGRPLQRAAINGELRAEMRRRWSGRRTFPRGLIPSPEAAEHQMNLALHRAAELGGSAEAIESAFRRYVDQSVCVLLAWEQFNARERKAAPNEGESDGVND